MTRLQRKRDEVLWRLIEETKQKKTSSSLKNDTIDVEKKRTLIETLFSLCKSEPEFYSDDVIKSMILVSYYSSFSLLLNGDFDHFLFLFFHDYFTCNDP